jgi:hypothetical protein
VPVTTKHGTTMTITPQGVRDISSPCYLRDDGGKRPNDSEEHGVTTDKVDDEVDQ